VDTMNFHEVLHLFSKNNLTKRDKCFSFMKVRRLYHLLILRVAPLSPSEATFIKDASSIMFHVYKICSAVFNYNTVLIIP
jgi:hypothetical protein